MINFKSYNDMSRDIAAGIQRVPPTDIVVGVPKSGIVPATIIASFLNVQVIDIESFLFAHSRRSGMRKLHSEFSRQRVLVVDDSVNTGREMRRIRERLYPLEADFDFTYCAVYGLEQGKHDAVTDIVLHYVPQPRVFQWNYRNHIWAEHALFDMDGVLCIDPPDDKNDDGELYQEYILNAPTLFIPQRRISAIVTSRLERFRPETEEWLKRNNVSYNELIMLDLPTAEERRRLRAHAPFKAKIYGERPEIIFVESNWKQARAIAETADKPVICTENDVFLYGADHLQRLQRSGQLFDYETLSTEQELRRQLQRFGDRLAQVDPNFDVDFGPVMRPRTPWQNEVVLESALRRNTMNSEPRPAGRARLRASGAPRRVLMISVSFDVKRGAGAAASALRLRDALAADGNEVKTIALEDFADKLRSYDQPTSTTHVAFWNQYHDGAHSRALLARINAVDPDVIVLGAVDRGILSALDLAMIDRPIVWVCRDNWVHTGGCLFKLDPETVETSPNVLEPFQRALTCTGYKSGCSDCPAIQEPRERIKARLGYELKRLVYGYRKDIVFAPISDWLTAMMRDAPLSADHVVETASNPIDLKLMAPVEGITRAQLRRRFGLPQEGSLVLFGAHSLGNPRKGVKPALDALAKREDFTDVTFVVIGTEKELPFPEALAGRIHNLGFLADEEAKSALYSAVDVTMVPALQESLSVVASDSIACGTPVVAFRTSGLATFLGHKETGYLAKPFDFDDLAQGLKWVLYEADRDALSRAARRVAEERFDPKANASRLHTLMDIAIEQNAKLGPVPNAITVLEKTLALMGEEHSFRYIQMRYLSKHASKPTAPVSVATLPHKLDDRVAELQQEVNALRNSTSWKITAPLRTLVRTFRR